VTGTLDVASISAIIAATSVVIGVVFAVLQLRNVAKTRKTQLIIQLNPALRINQKEMNEAWAKIWTLEYEDYKEFVEKYGGLVEANPASNAIATYSGYFEGIGFLSHRELIEIGIVEYITSGSEGVKLAWGKIKPTVYSTGKEYNTPTAFQWFEYLYNEMQKGEEVLS